METIVLDGKEYVKASKAAQDIGYTTDYVGQLCRSGKIGSRLIGRSWYVSIDELSSHRTGSKRTARIKAHEQVQKTLKERLSQEIVGQGKHYERHIPEVQKVQVESARTVLQQSKKVLHTAKKEKEPDYTIENEGKKIVMSGKLEITDATDEEVAIDEHTVILKPKIVKVPKERRNGKNQKTVFKGISEQEITDPASLGLSEKTNKNKDISSTETQQEMDNFLKKLEQYEVVTGETETVEERAVQTETKSLVVEVPASQQTNVLEADRSRYIPVSLALISVILGFGALFLETSWSYTSNADSEAETHFETNFTNDLPALWERILSRVPWL
jgi:hypothetical protein